MTVPAQASLIQFPGVATAMRGLPTPVRTVRPVRPPRDRPPAPCAAARLAAVEALHALPMTTRTRSGRDQSRDKLAKIKRWPAYALAIGMFSLL